MSRIERRNQPMTLLIDHFGHDTDSWSAAFTDKRRSRRLDYLVFSSLIFLARRY